VFFFIFERFVYIYIYCKTFNAEFNKLIKTVGHLARFIEKMELKTPGVANNFDVIWIFSYSYQVLKL